MKKNGKKAIILRPCWSCRVIWKHHPGRRKPGCTCDCGRPGEPSFTAVIRRK